MVMIGLNRRLSPVSKKMERLEKINNDFCDSFPGGTAVTARGMW